MHDAEGLGEQGEGGVQAKAGGLGAAGRKPGGFCSSWEISYRLQGPFLPFQIEDPQYTPMSPRPCLSGLCLQSLLGIITAFVVGSPDKSA